jgi:hypothetical protein
MDFLIKFLAQLFSGFKVKNPVIAAGILFGLGVILNGASTGEFYGLFTLPEWGVEVVRYITMFLMAVTGSQTFQYLQPEQSDAKKNKA